MGRNKGTAFHDFSKIIKLEKNFTDLFGEIS